VGKGNERSRAYQKGKRQEQVRKNGGVPGEKLGQKTLDLTEQGSFVSKINRDRRGNKGTRRPDQGKKDINKLGKKSATVQFERKGVERLRIGKDG